VTETPARTPLEPPEVPTPPVDGFRWRTLPIGPVLESTALAALADHLFTTRRLRLRGDAEPREWAEVASALAVERRDLLWPKQVHGHVVLVHRRGSPVPRWSDGGPDADIIATDDPDVAVAVQVADCIPLLLADPVSGAVAAAHAGWRGSVARVAAHAVSALQEGFGARPADVEVAFGPSIGPCCYEVGPEVREAFLTAGFAPGSVDTWFADGRSRGTGDRTSRTGSHSRLWLDLWAANHDQLTAAGIQPPHIHLSRMCTVHHRGTFFSYRAEGPDTGRIVGAIRAGGHRS